MPATFGMLKKTNELLADKMNALRKCKATECVLSMCLFNEQEEKTTVKELNKASRHDRLRPIF